MRQLAGFIEVVLVACLVQTGSAEIPGGIYIRTIKRL